MKNAVCYGSLYIDEGEDFKFAKKQIYRVMKKANKSDNQPIGWYFDVLGWENQRKQGEMIAGKIEKYIKTNYPHLKTVEVGFTSNEHTGERPRK